MTLLFQPRDGRILRARRRLGAAIALALVVAAASCTFPEYIVPGDSTSSSGNAGGATPTSSSSGEMPTSTSTSSSVGGVGSTSASMSSTGTLMGPTCGEPCVTTDGAACSPSCTGADPECDCDDDGEILDTPACKTAHPMATVDCYDCNAKAKHGTTGYEIVDRGDGSFDFDCSNLEEAQYDTACGAGMVACTKPFKYDVSPGCGNIGNLFACRGTIGCQLANTSNPTPQACH